MPVNAIALPVDGMAKEPVSRPLVALKEPVNPGRSKGHARLAEVIVRSRCIGARPPSSVAKMALPATLEKFSTRWYAGGETKREPARSTVISNPGLKASALELAARVQWSGPAKSLMPALSAKV